MPLSPIEQMIDKATGYKPPNGAPRTVWDAVHCDGCGKHRRVFIARTKPHRLLCTACLTRKGKP